MGSSTKTLQSVVDYLRLAGELAPSPDNAGYAVGPLCAIADDVMNAILGEEFPWKFNSFKLAPVYTNPWQQDYPSVNETGIGWLEHCVAVDVNNTSLPKPKYWPKCVRDLEPTSWQQSPPARVCWEYNQNLEYAPHPGPGAVYSNPAGALQMPANAPTAVYDPGGAGNILLLTAYGTTGPVVPYAGGRPAPANADVYNLPQNAAPGLQVPDGTCWWTVCNPVAQGIRLGELPPQQGVVYKLFFVAQRNPLSFRSLGQTLDPLPDDYASLFREGYKAHATALSPNPGVRATAAQAIALWQGSIARALKKGDREAESKGFVPDAPLMNGAGWGRIGPADPYGWG